MTLADVYFARQYEVLTRRAKVKWKTMQRRKTEYLAEKAVSTENENRLLVRTVRCPDYFSDVQGDPNLSPVPPVVVRADSNFRYSNQEGRTNEFCNEFLFDGASTPAPSSVGSTGTTLLGAPLCLWT